jgi:hypothetical protein
MNLPDTNPIHPQLAALKSRLNQVPKNLANLREEKLRRDYEAGLWNPFPVTEREEIHEIIGYDG